MKYTKEEIEDYVTGFLIYGHDTHDTIAVKAMLLNALNMLEDDQDGIEAVTERIKSYPKK